MSSDDTGNQSHASDRQDKLDEILADLMRAIDGDESVDRTEWVTRHPDFTDELEEFFDKHERMERLVRPLRQAAAHVLHVRCPHCHNPIELLEDAPLTDISCPSCGSSFSLVGDNMSTQFPGGMKTVGHFELLDRVGIGQFGSVWKARDTKLDRTVAVKIPRSERLDESQTELFLRDARAAAQLKHPNIVSVHEVGKQDDTIYIVSDFIEGATLKEWIAAKRLTPRESAELCIKIAKALHHAHEAGVIHRDLKPGNIMMDTEGEPHIVDFGLAKREAGEITMTVEGQVLGTPAYMPPEQARGEGHTVDRRADLYSLGVILFELLTGELPFRGDKQMLIVQILNDDPLSPRKLNSAIPRDLETICLKCLEKDPRRRIGTAREVAEDIARWLSGWPILARPSSRLERVMKWSRRRPAVAAMLAVTTVSALALIAGLIVSNVIIGRALDDRTAALNQLTIEEGITRQALIDLGKQESETRDALGKLSKAHQDLDRTLKEERGRTYQRSIMLAQRDWEANALGRANSFLDECPVDLHGIEWFYLKRQCNHPGMLSIPRVFSPRLTYDIPNKTLSGDGRRFAMATSEDALQIVDPITGKRIRETPISVKRFVNNLILSDHTDLLATCGQVRLANVKDPASRIQSVVEVWNTENGRRVCELTLPKRSIKAMALSPNGKLLATTNMVWATAAQPGPRRRGSAGGSIKEVKVFDIATSSELGTLPLENFPINYVIATFSADGNFLATNHILWNLSTMSKLREIEGRVLCHAFSPNGKRLTVGIAKSQTIIGDWRRTPRAAEQTDNAVVTFNTESGDRVSTLHRRRDLVIALAYSQDGSLLAVGSARGFIEIRRSSDEGLLMTLRGQTRGIQQMAFSEDGKRLIVVDNVDNVCVWDVVNPQEALTIRGCGGLEGYTATFSRDGQLVASISRDWTVKVWRSATGEELHAFEGHKRDVYDVAFSPDGVHLASAGRGGTKLWSLKSGRLVREFIPEKSAYCARVHFSHDGHRLAAAHDRGASIWRVESGEKVQDLPSKSQWFSSAYFSPDDQSVITVDRYSKLQIWKTDTGEEILRKDKLRGRVATVLFSPDGRYFATAGIRPRIWDTTTGQELNQFLGHDGATNTVAFNRDGSRLATAGADGTIKIWDSLTGAELLTLTGHRGAVFSAQFSPTGERLVSSGADGTVRIWDATPLPQE